MGKRTLRDLFVVGTPLKLSDGENTVEVYIKKMNDARHDKAMKRASAAKSRMRSVLKDENSEEYQAILETVQEFGRDGCISYLLEDFRYSKEKVVEAEIGAEDEWSDEDYLEGLREAWLDGLNDEYAKDPEHPEAKRVFDEMKRFSEQVNKELQGRVEAQRRDLETKTDEQLEKMVVGKYAEVRSASAWLEEFRKCEIWLSTFEPDRQTLAMPERSMVDDLESETKAKILETLEEISTPGVEGKDSPDKATS